MQATGERAAALADAYLAIGATPSFTCAPYLLESAPAAGEHVGWGESNAVVYANSVLGARTQKYADFLDACVALTGRAPAAGAHLDDGRRATLELRIPALPPAATRDDSVFPTLGYACGLHAEGRVAVLSGLEDAAPTADELKAFSAAFGTTAAAPLFHIAGVTPEAPTVAAAVGLGANDADKVEAREVTADDLRPRGPRSTRATTRRCSSSRWATRTSRSSGAARVCAAEARRPAACATASASSSPLGGR